MTERIKHVPYFLHALTPVHIGGHEGLGGLDLPQLRECHTGYPIVPGSSVKGVLRREAEIQKGEDSEEVLAVFGPQKDNAGDFRGGAVFTDAQLLALPVRSLAGTFAWVTCPFALKRLRRDFEMTALKNAASWKSWKVVKLSEALITRGTSPLIPAQGSQVLLEDLRLSPKEDEKLADFAAWLAKILWPGDKPMLVESRSFFVDRLLLVHDDLFGFLCRLGLEVRDRISIDDARGTVKDGPWSEESLPAESLMHGLVVSRSTQYRKRKKDKLSEDGVEWYGDKILRVLHGIAAKRAVLRFGGNASVGHGQASFRMPGGDDIS